MSLNIRDAEVHRLARDVAAATGETMTDAVQTALRERLERVRRVEVAEAQRRYEAIMEFARWWREQPIDDPRPFNEILGYDEEGLPR